MTTRRRGRPREALTTSAAKYIELAPSGIRPTAEELEALRTNPWPDHLRSEHWIWTGYTSSYRGQLVPRLRGKSAARLLYEYLIGPIPEDHRLHRMYKDDFCVSPFCVNPAHRVVWPIFSGPVQYHLIKEPEPLPEPEPEEVEEPVNPEMLDAGKFFSSKLPNMTVEEMAELYNEHPKYIEACIECYQNSVVHPRTTPP